MLFKWLLFINRLVHVMAAIPFGVMILLQNCQIKIRFCVHFFNVVNSNNLLYLDFYLTFGNLCGSSNHSSSPLQTSTAQILSPSL